MNKLPIVYIRGYGGPTAGINTVVEDPFYGFNSGSTHIRVAGDGVPAFYQFEGPLVRLISDEGYHVYVHGSQQAVLDDTSTDLTKTPSIWIYRFYDQAATTFAMKPHENLFQRIRTWGHQEITSDGFDIEGAARGLYDLIEKIIDRTADPKTGVPGKVNLVAHSMGGLIARCMIQKVCQMNGRKPATELVSKLFTYGTPHGGIRSAGGIAQWVEETFGPAGSKIFAPELMQGYLDPGKEFGQLCDKGWDPQVIKPPAVFPVEDIFCLIGTDPDDYGWAPRTAMGPQTDGLVHIDNAYVRGAHRAYIHRSHSGPYGEVNSEEGYQNLRRFLFGRWAVSAALVDASLPQDPSFSWQLDIRLSIRGLSVVMSEQMTEHWCPIMLTAPDSQPDPLAQPGGVPLAGTFLLDPRDQEYQLPGADGRMRYTLTLRLFKVPVSGKVFDFSNTTEQVPYWQDWLIADVEPDADAGTLRAYAAWGSLVPGADLNPDPISQQLPPEEGGQDLTFTADGAFLEASVPLTKAAAQNKILGGQAKISIRVSSR